MPMLDSNLIFAAAQAPTSHLADTASTNVVDTGDANGGSDLSQGTPPLWAIATVKSTATSGGSATVQAVLQDSADNATFADVIAGPAVAVASVTAGTVLLVTPLPAKMRRYQRFAWRIGTADLTAGAFDAYYASNPQINIAPTPKYTVA